MTIEELQEQKKLLTLTVDDFTDTELFAAYQELKDIISFFLGSLWFAALISRFDLAQLGSAAPFSAGITYKDDAHLQYGLGITIDQVQNHHLSVIRMNAPGTLSAILSIVEMVLFDHNPNKHKKYKALKSEAQKILDGAIKHRQPNLFDQIAYLIHRLSPFLGRNDKVIYCIQHLAELKHKRNKYLHKDSNSQMQIDNSDVSDAWYYAVKLLITMDKKR